VSTLTYVSDCSRQTVDSTPLCDDFAGYKAGFEKGMTEIGCMANKRQLAEGVLEPIGALADKRSPF
jgi:hypothetical protein